jgi:hypothetical protein
LEKDSSRGDGKKSLAVENMFLMDWVRGPSRDGGTEKKAVFLVMTILSLLPMF